MSHAAKAYLREVKRLIPFPGSMKASFLRQLEDELFLYCDEHSGADTAALKARFGTPDDVAQEFLDALDPVIVGRSIQNRQRVLCLFMAAVVVAAAIMGIQTIYIHSTADDNSITFIPYEGALPEASGPAYWIRTSDGDEVYYWEFDYDLNEWVNVPTPNE